MDRRKQVFLKGDIMLKLKNIVLGSLLALISSSSYAAVSLNVGLVLGAYHRDPTVRTVYVNHQSPYVGISGPVELLDEEPTILPYDEDCTEYGADCENTYVVVDHVRIGGVIYPYTSVVVLNPRHTRVIRVRPYNDIAFAQRWHTRVVTVTPTRERVVVNRGGFLRKRPRERHVYVVGRGKK